MVKLICFILTFFFSISINAQSHLGKDSTLSLSALDSLLLDFDTLDKPKSYFDVTIGIGNKEFSQKNNAVNSSQANKTQLYYTPSLTYNYKKGFSLSITPFLSVIDNKFKIYQTSIRPGYEFTNKNIYFSFDYTHYFADNKSYNGNSIFQNEFYTSLKYKKYYLIPSIAIGYSTGNYKEINVDTLRTFPQIKLLKDSTHNTISDFNISFSIGHNYEFEKLFTKYDALSLYPQISISGSTQNYTTTHINKIYTRLLNVSKKVKSLTSNNIDAFQIQSLSCSISADYQINKFTFSPNIFSDYYLPSTTDKRLSTIFSFAVGYTF